MLSEMAPFSGPPPSRFPGQRRRPPQQADVPRVVAGASSDQDLRRQLLKGLKKDPRFVETHVKGKRFPLGFFLIWWKRLPVLAFHLQPAFPRLQCASGVGDAKEQPCDQRTGPPFPSTVPWTIQKPLPKDRSKIVLDKLTCWLAKPILFQGDQQKSRIRPLCEDQVTETSGWGCGACAPRARQGSICLNHI